MKRAKRPNFSGFGPVFPVLGASGPKIWSKIWTFRNWSCRKSIDGKFEVVTNQARKRAEIPYFSRFGPIFPVSGGRGPKTWSYIGTFKNFSCCISMDRKFEAVYESSNEKGENTIFFRIWAHSSSIYGVLSQNVVRNWSFVKIFMLHINRLQICRRLRTMPKETM